jgi:hypothetical protein
MKKECLNYDCRKLFEAETDKKLYCSQRCAQHAQKANREAKAKILGARARHKIFDI